MGNNAYDSVGETMDKAWVESTLSKMLVEGTEKPNIYFLPKDDPFWSIASKPQGMYFAEPLDKDSPEWSDDAMVGIRSMGGISTENNIILPKGKEITPKTEEAFSHELLHYLDDIAVDQGFEEKYGYTTLSDMFLADRSQGTPVEDYRLTIPLMGAVGGGGTGYKTTQTSEQRLKHAYEYGHEKTAFPPEILAHYTEKSRAKYPRYFAEQAAASIVKGVGPKDIDILDLTAYIGDISSSLETLDRLSGKYLTDYGRGQYYFDPSGSGYDYARADELGYQRSDDPSGEDHLPSIDSETGMVLKGRGNKKEWDLMVEEEKKLGNIIVKGDTIGREKDRWYTVPKPEDLSKEDIFAKYPDLFKVLYE